MGNEVIFNCISLTSRLFYFVREGFRIFPPDVQFIYFSLLLYLYQESKRLYFVHYVTMNCEEACTLSLIVKLERTPKPKDVAIFHSYPYLFSYQSCPFSSFH